MKSAKKKQRVHKLVELSFLEALSLRCRQDRDILMALGDLYTELGYYKEGLQVDLELSRLFPGEALMWYNLACSYARTNGKDQAFLALNRAVDLGYRDVGWMRKDADLDSIRQDQRFRKILLRMATGAHSSDCKP